MLKFNSEKHTENILLTCYINYLKNTAFDIKVLNSLDYGIPQIEKRLFVVGFKKLHF